MTKLERRALASSLAAAGLLLSGGMALAATPDVSSIYGRGSPPNAHITAVSTPAVTNTQSAVGTGSAVKPDSDATYEYHAPASIHGEKLDGTPLVEGRGMREGVDQYASAPVQPMSAFDVTDVLGRSSPPAPANAPDFGHPG